MREISVEQLEVMGLELVRVMEKVEGVDYLACAAIIAIPKRLIPRTEPRDDDA